MRTSRFIPTLATALTAVVGACGAPVASGPAPVRPMQLTIVRPEYDKVLVQTNRYAYVALFEILPDRGVSIVYPATAHQASESLAGMHWLPVSLQPNHVTYRGFPPRRVVRDHYLYAIASDVPFRISDSDYDPETLSSELGDEAYRGRNVAATMRALAREFGPALPPQDWAEDSYALEEAQETPVVRVYCGDDEAIEIRETIVARVNCSSRPPTVYGNTGGSSGRSGGYAPPRSGPTPVASNPTPAPTPTPRPAGPWAPFPRRDSVTQAGTPRDSIRRPPVLHLPGGTWPASDSSSHGGQSGNGQGDDDHHGQGDNGRGNGGVPGNGGVNAGGQGDNGNHGHGDNGNGHGNGSDNGRGNGGVPGNGGVNAGGNGNGNGHGNGSDNGRGNGGVPGNGGVNAGNGNGSSNGNAGSNGNGSSNAGNSHGNAGSSNGSSHGNGNGNGHGNATPGIGDANPHGSSPTVNGNAPRLPFGLRMPTSSPNRAATTQPAPSQQPASAPAQQPTKTDSAKPAPPRHMMPPVKAKPDSSDKK